jgi:hypothetical protein
MGLSAGPAPQIEKFRHEVAEAEIKRIGAIAKRLAEDNPQLKPKVWFVSGHLDLTPEEFKQHYYPPIRQTLYDYPLFLVGDAPGCDELFQRLMCAAGLSSRVQVYHMLDRPRRWVLPQPKERGRGQPIPSSTLVGGYQTDEDRDSDMTDDSDDDIADRKSTRLNSSHHTTQF